jgi:hypothetical protein
MHPISHENSGNHLHRGQEGHEGDDVACKTKRKKGVKIRRFAKVFKGVPSYLLGEEDKSQ